MAGHVKPVTNERDVVSDCVKKGVRVVRLDSLSRGAAARAIRRLQHIGCLDPSLTSGWDTAKVITAIAEVHHLVGGYRHRWKRHNHRSHRNRWVSAWGVTCVGDGDPLRRGCFYL